MDYGLWTADQAAPFRFPLFVRLTSAGSGDRRRFVIGRLCVKTDFSFLISAFCFESLVKLLWGTTRHVRIARVRAVSGSGLPL